MAEFGNRAPSKYTSFAGSKSRFPSMSLKERRVEKRFPTTYTGYSAKIRVGAAIWGETFPTPPNKWRVIIWRGS